LQWRRRPTTFCLWARSPPPPLTPYEVSAYKKKGKKDEGERLEKGGEEGKNRT